MTVKASKDFSSANHVFNTESGIKICEFKYYLAPNKMAICTGCKKNKSEDEFPIFKDALEKEYRGKRCKACIEGDSVVNLQKQYILELERLIEDRKEETREYREENRDLRVENQSLRDFFSTLRREIDNLRDEIDELRRRSEETIYRHGGVRPHDRRVVRSPRGAGVRRYDDAPNLRELSSYPENLQRRNDVRNDVISPRDKQPALNSFGLEMNPFM